MAKQQQTRLFITLISLVVAVFVYVFLRPSTPKNIVFVTIDTLRADHVGAYGYPRPVSPFLDSLAERGTLFEKAFSAAPHTAPSHASMFTSLFPFEHNLLRNQETLDSSLFNLYELTTSAGYKAQAFPAVKFLEGKVGFPFTKDISDAKDKDFKKHWYRSATNVIDNAISWLENLKSSENTFIWLHFYDVHQWNGRKNLPKKFMKLVEALPQSEHLKFLIEKQNTPVSFFGSEEKTLDAINGYDAHLLYVDTELKRFSDYLDSRGVGQNTAWIVLSDHGEGLGNHNYEGHGQFLYQEQLHIPLIIAGPGELATKQRIGELVRTVDLLPTIADIAKNSMDTSKHKIEGLSLLPLIKSGQWNDAKVENVFAERRSKDEISFRKDWEAGEIYSLHDLEGKYIEHSEGTDEYYDFKTDPFEMKNQAGTKSTEESDLRKNLFNLFDPSKRKSSDGGSETPEEVEELKSLGYL